MATDAGPPRLVRLAGAMVALQGAGGAVVAVALVVRALTGSVGLTVALGTAIWFAVCAAALLAVGTGLWRGGRWARSPVVVAQLLLLGVAWYAIGPSSRPGYGIPGAVYCLAVLVLLFSGPATRWAYGGAGVSDPRAE